ncbi:MAG TPA: hypothetical protein VJS92_16455 [Candidatus Polarisedimenticolaceae bacterium]|nr:hypothetical protein [Candidatus Polarisedimenticolaceae bacterium]
MIFQELNLYVYYSVTNSIYDAVIWCLGPFVDDSREYSVVRLCLARVTRSACRRWYRVRD